MHRLAALWDDAEQGDGRQFWRHLDQVLEDAHWSDEDRAWAVAWLLGRRSARLLDAKALRALALAATGHPDWLLDECLAAGGDVAEYVAHAMPAAKLPQRLGPAAAATLLAQWRTLPPAQRGGVVAGALADRDAATRCLLLRLASGARMPAVPARALRDGLARQAGIEPARMALRLGSLIEPTEVPGADRWRRLMRPVRAASAAAGVEGALQVREERESQELLERAADTDDETDQLPLAAPPLLRVDRRPTGSGPWLALPLRGGQRVQVVRHSGGVQIWSDAGEPMATLHPALARDARAWPVGTVVEGELSAAGLQIVDLLRMAGQDLRQQPWPDRFNALAGLGPSAPTWSAGPAHRLVSADELAALHARLRRLGARALRFAEWNESAEVRVPGVPSEWPAAALTLRTVLVYVEAHPRGPVACELALWSRAPRDAAEAGSCADAFAAAAARGQASPAAPDPSALRLQPLARTALGLHAEDRQRLAAVVAATAVQRFGPVTALRPSLVVELAFDAVVPQPRRRAGLGVDAARMLRLLPDVPIAAAHTVADAAELAGGGTVAVPARTWPDEVTPPER